MRCKSHLKIAHKVGTATLVYAVSLSITNFEIISTITAGVAVLLAIITFFSTPILTAIFGDGSFEVYEHERLGKRSSTALTILSVKGEMHSQISYFS